MDADPQPVMLDGDFSGAGRAKAQARRMVRSWLWMSWVDGLEASKRLLDLAAAAGAGAVAAPVWVPLVLASIASGRHPVRRWHRIGRFGEPFDELCLELPGGRAGKLLASAGADRIPALLNVLRGDMSLVGPRPVDPREMSPGDVRSRRRQDVRPGLFNAFWVRSRTNVDYDPEFDVDRDYVETRSLKGDVGLLARSALTAFYGGKVVSTPDKVVIRGIPVHNRTMAEAVEEMVQFLDAPQPTRVCFVNADCVNLAARDAQYQQTLRSADYILADGIGMKLAGRVLGRPIRQNVNGTDLFPRLMDALKDTRHGVFLLGARPGVAEGVREWVVAHGAPDLIRGTRDGYFKAAEEDEVCRQIAASGADLLLVAFGAPRQDTWILRNQARCGVKMAIGVGGLFDFFSGRIQRAPEWMREAGLEWTWRLKQEPGRMWKRYGIGNAVFLARVLSDRIRDQE